MKSINSTIAKYRKSTLYLAPLSVLIVYVVPLLFGYSWYPSPNYPFAELPSPIHNVAYDAYSYVHVLWPWRAIESAQFLTGKFPLWNSFQSLGLPLPEQIENQLFFPLEWIEANLGVFGWNIAYLLRIYIAALGIYLLSIKFTRNRLSAFGAVIAYSFSAYFLWFPSNISFVNGAAIVPWIFLCLYRICSTIKIRVKDVSLMGLVGGLLILTGQPQIVALTFLACFITVLICTQWRTLNCPNSRAPLIKCFYALLIAGLIGLVQIYALYKIIHLGYSLHSPNAYAGGGTAFLNIQATLWPFLTGQLHEPWNPNIFLKELNNEALPLVIGATQLLLGCIGIYALFVNTIGINPRSCSFAKALTIVLGLIILVIGLGMSAYPIWGGPVLGRINFPRYSMPIFSTILSLLVAMAIEFVYRNSRIKLGVPAFFAVFIIICAGLSILFSPINSNNIPSLDYKWKSILLGIFPFAFALITTVLVIYIARQQEKYRKNLRGSLLFCLLSEPLFFIRYGFEIDLEIIRLISVLLICAAAVFWLYGKFKFAIMMFLLSLILTCTLLQFSSRHLQVQFDPFKESTPAYINFLQSQLGSGSKLGRILSSEQTLSPVTLGVYGVASLTSFGPQQIKTTAQFIFGALSDRPINYTTPVMWMGMDVNDVKEGSPSWFDYFKRRQFYNLVAVRFLVDGKNGWLSRFPVEGITKVYSDDGVDIYEDKFALSRVFGIKNGQLVYSPDEAFKEMISGKFSVKKHAYVECVGCGKDEIKALNARLSGMSGLGDVKELEVIKFTQSNIEVSVNSDEDHLVVVSDAYYPGWHAEIDGSPAQLLRINGALRGVLVHKNSKIVSFKYMPYDLFLCFAISLIGIFSVISYILISRNKIYKADSSTKYNFE
jgi:hypothetical protein